MPSARTYLWLTSRGEGDALSHPLLFSFPLHLNVLLCRHHHTNSNTPILGYHNQYAQLKIDGNPLFSLPSSSLILILIIARQTTSLQGQCSLIEDDGSRCRVVKRQLRQRWPSEPSRAHSYQHLQHLSTHVSPSDSHLHARSTQTHPADHNGPPHPTSISDRSPS